MRHFPFLFVLLWCCESPPKSSSHIPDQHAALPDQQIAIDSSRFAVLTGDTQTFTPTQAEIRTAYHLVSRRIAIYNAEQQAQDIDFEYSNQGSSFHRHEAINFDKYYKQCLPSINDKGEKTLLFNCLCELSNWSRINQDWKQNLLVVHDGGDCFFKISVNLNRGVVYGFVTNGME